MSDPYEKSPRQVSESVIELAVHLHEAAVREVDEFNEMYDRMVAAELKAANADITNKELKENLDKVLGENEELLCAYKKMEKGVDEIMSNANKHLQYAEQAKREKAQMADKLLKSDMALAPYKVLGTAKKIREQIKDYKTKAEANQKTITAVKLEARAYRKDIVELTGKCNTLKNSMLQATIQTVWSENGDHLLMFPTPLTMEINGVIEKQLTLLFMNQSGCGKLIGIDEDGEPKLCVMPKGGLKPKAPTLAKAGNVLRKFKAQNWVVSHQDLLAIQE